MRRFVTLVVVLVSAVVLAAPLQAGDQVTLSWVAGGAGGGWYSMAGGIATIIKEADPDIVIKVIPGGGLQNPAVVADKGAEMGWGLPFLNAAAYKGMAPFEKPLTDLRALAGGMSMNYFHFYVDAESPFNSMDEIFGQKKKMRIAISQAGSSDTWVLERVLEAYKTSIPELEKAGFVFASEIALKYLEPFGITKGIIPKGTYDKAANTKDVVTAASGSVITVSKDMPEALAYRLTKAFNDSVDKVHKIHASLEPYEVKDGPTGCGTPLHPGAIKYYKEKGLLK
jgi:TRAP-type uncharacterized transport system substrate-binding protein